MPNPVLTVTYVCGMLTARKALTLFSKIPLNLEPNTAWPGVFHEYIYIYRLIFISGSMTSDSDDHICLHARAVLHDKRVHDSYFQAPV